MCDFAACSEVVLMPPTHSGAPLQKQIRKSKLIIIILNLAIGIVFTVLTITAQFLQS
jgi:hypothetical protein